MGDHTAFFYGTLMAPAVLNRVIYGRAEPEKWQKKLTTVRPALLQSYRRHRVKDADYPAIVPTSENDMSSVRGSVVTGLTDGDIWRLDIFEGDQYERRRLRIKVLKDVAFDQLADESNLQVVEEVEAETYVWSDPREDLEEKEWDFEEFKRDKMRAWTGEVENDATKVDDGFADVDRAVQNGEMPDPTRGRGHQGKISQQLAEAAI